MKASAQTWMLRCTWAALGVVAPWTQFESHSTPVRVVLATWGWASWAAGLVGLAVVAPLALTAVRIGAPLLTALSWAAVIDGAWGSSADSAAAALASVSWLLSMSAAVCTDMAQGAAYGDEVRLPLRTPLPQLIPAAVAWSMFAAAAVGATLLLAAGNSVAGAPLAAIGLLLGVTVPRRLHVLSRRWLVFVPAGIVVHDHLVLGESLMIRTPAISAREISHRPGTEADLTGGVAGRRLVVTLRQPEKVLLAPITARILGTVDVLHVSAFAVAPRVPRSRRLLVSG